MIWQFLITQYNQHQIEEVIQLGKEMGVDRVSLKTAQIYEIEKNEDWVPTNHTYSRYKKDEDGKMKIKNKLKNRCWRMWHSCVITWDGRVVPCCFDKHAIHNFGNAGKEPLSKIWRNDKYQNFRNQILQKRKSINICTNCSEGGKVWVSSKNLD